MFGYGKAGMMKEPDPTPKENFAPFSGEVVRVYTGSGLANVTMSG